MSPRQAPAPRRGAAAVRCACGAALPRRARFCPGCGSPAGLHAAAPLPEAVRRLLAPQVADRLLVSRGRVPAERRVITILFADVKGSTALAERLDPEDVMEIMNGAFGALLEPVYRYEGTLARLMGDGLLCFFGAPVAHEDDPQRACRCALALLAAARDYATRLEGERELAGFDVRVGLHTGLVVVGEVGDERRVEYTAMGDAVNLAARLEALARPGTALLSESTRELVAGEFETEPLGAQPIRGRAEPVAVYRLLAEQRGGRAGARAPTREPELVGRARELGVLETVMAAAASGRAQAVALTGDPGIGKSRLLSEMRSRWSAGTWFETRCVAYEENTGYGAARRLLECMLEAQPVGAPDLRHLGRLLELHPEQCDDADPRCADPESFRGALHHEFRRLVRTMAEAGPLALVLEDLHWADASSLELITALFALSPDCPLLLVLTYRPEPALRELWSRAAREGRLACRELALERLTHEDSLLLAGRWAAAADLPSPMLERFAAVADGNPFFLEQLSGCVRDGTVLPGGGTAGAGAGSVSRLEVPATVQGVITARLDRLDPGSRRVLQAASLLGREFRAATLVRLSEPELSGGEVARALQDLRERELLERSEGVDGFSFRHALTAEVAYQSLLMAERRRLHARAARVIQEAEPERAEILAHHLEAAGEVEAALGFVLQAAARAAGLCAFHEAITHYRAALRLRSAALPAGRDGPCAELAGLHERLGEACTVIGDLGHAASSFETALALSTEPRQRAALRRRLGAVLEKQGRYSEARAALEAAVESMASDLDPAEAARIFSALGLVYYRTRDLANAAEIGELALDMLEKGEDPRALAHACNNLALVQAERRDWARARALHERALALWETARDPYGLASAHHNLALTLQRQGEPRAAVPHLDRAVTLFSRVGNGYGLARAHDSLGRIYLELGELAASQNHMERAATLLADLTVGESGIACEMWQSGAW